MVNELFMPEQAYGKPAQTFGGDDDEDAYTEPAPKLKLHRYGLSPDKNIRDIFWTIMGSYASTRKPGLELSEYGNERFSLIRVAATTIETNDGVHYDLPPGFISRYTLMMVLDADWGDAFVEFIEECKEGRGNTEAHLITSMRYVWKNENYHTLLTGYFSDMLRSRTDSQAALYYLARIKNKELAKALKRELIILARGDVGENQLNAIKALSLILEDEDVRKAFQIILSHWDVEARKLAVQLLMPYKKDEGTKASAARRLSLETNEEVKKLLSKLAK